MVNENNNESAIFRTWRPACIGAWIFFFICQGGIGLDYYMSEKPLCPFSDKDYPLWYWYICYGVLGAFVIIWLVVLSKISQIEQLEDKVPHIIAFNIISMGTLATILSLFLNWGGLCIDVLGVASPAAIWGEWCACGPLLIYIVVSLDNKPKLNKTDWFLMGTFFLCLITGFFIIIPSSIAVGIFWLVVSCVTYIPLLYLPCYCKSRSSIQLVSVDGDIIESHMEHILSRKQKLAWVLTIILPLYTVNYLIAYGGGITPAETIAIYQILSVLTKGLFACAAMDIHLDLLEGVRRALSLERNRRAVAEENFRNINEARRNFLKYIFHELRSPLNSLTIGLEVLEQSEGLNQGDFESVGVMKVATSFMGDTLNNILNIQKLEDGKLELEMAPFCIGDSVEKIKAAMRGGLTQKRVRLEINKSSAVPERLLGDGIRIEHVIGNLVSNAIKFCPEDSVITVDISLEPPTNDSKIEIIDLDTDKVTVLLSVQDKGPGISPTDQEKLFNNFSLTRPDELQKGSGPGLGLTISRQIVELHGGRIGVNSVEGGGSQFFFAIPFQICWDLSAPRVKALTTAFDLPVSGNQQGVVHLKDSGASTKASEPNELESKVEGSISTKLRTKSVRISPFQSSIALRVIVVDDSEASVKMLKMLLKKLAIAADTAENGRIAVDMIMGAAEPYHLVLMDNLMPEMNGVEATRLLRQQGCNALIIGVTGNVLEDDIAEYLSAGANLVLSKPMRIRSLELILDFLSQHGPVISRPYCRIEEYNNQIRWVETNTNTNDNNNEYECH